MFAVGAQNPKPAWVSFPAKQSVEAITASFAATFRIAALSNQTEGAQIVKTTLQAFAAISGDGLFFGVEPAFDTAKLIPGHAQSYTQIEPSVKLMD